MTIRTGLVLILLLLPAATHAQSLEVFAMTGAVQLWNDESRLGIGMPIAGGIGFRSPHGWGIEALFERQRATRTFDSTVKFDSTVTAASTRLLKYFGSGRVTPFAGGGIGVTRVRSTFDYPADCALGPNNQFSCARRDITSRSTVAGTLTGVAGLRIAAGGRVFVRPEFQLSRAGEHLRMGGTVAVGTAW